MIKGPEHLEKVAAYKPGASAEEIQREYGLSNVEKLASNENPLGASPVALDAVKAALESSHIYGDGGAALRDALSSFHDLPEAHFAVNNGSDAIIHQLMRTLLLPGEHGLTCRGGFVSFQIASKTVGSEPRFVPQAEGYRFDVEALANAIEPSTKMVYIPNPNNPTGTYVTKDEIDWLLQRIPESTLLILDEAYVQYATHLKPDTYPNALDIDRPNVLSLRTFSKAYGLAAFRVGYAVGHPDVIHWLRKTKLPFDPNAIGCVAAVAALGDQAHVQKTVELNANGLELLHTTLENNNYTTSTSVANFVMVDCGSPENATAFHRSLLEEGFITRPLAGFGLPNCVRISTGTEDQNQRVAETVARLAVTQ